MKSYKFKLRPSKTVQIKLEQTLVLCRELYNSALQERREAWKVNRISINYHIQRAQLPEIKIIRPEFNNIYSQILQDIIRRVGKTFDDFFRRLKRGEKVGFPRFKSKNFFDSFAYVQSGFRLDDDKLYLSKIGIMRIRQSRVLQGKIKTCIIKREVSGWFAIFTVENNPQPLPKTNQHVGIDAGIEFFITLSDGTQIQNPKWLQNTQQQLRLAQRSIARKKKGSKLRAKAILKLKKIHQKTKNQRNDFQHKISTRLVNEFDLIAIEKLQIKNLVKNNRLASTISDAAWNTFSKNFAIKLKMLVEN